MSENAEENLNSLKKISFHYWLLYGIIAFAAVLRLWKFPEMQFMHDEVSAILRSTAGSFSEVIYKQTTTDVHPVGIPVFLHYWVMMFGRGELAVRLPFILCGLLSIYYSFKIAEKWFNPTVALFTAAFLASLQCPTMYGQLARPYATGMLFSVMMCWFWTQFFFAERSKQNRYAAGFVLFAALCCYNHYFSLLFALIVGATGIVFIDKENWKKYLLCNVLVFLLFIPHISIMLFHLKMGGGGEDSWLGKPQPDWLITFLKYLFHYSSMVGIVVAAALGAGFYFRTKDIRSKNKLRIVALIWALLGPLLAYIYSVFGTPVLQFSSFTFSLPFLFMLMFSLLGEMNKGLLASFVGLILLVNTYSLFRERKHYPLFYNQPYEQMTQVSNKAIGAFGESNVSIALTAMPGFVDFYFDKYKTKFNYLKADFSEVKAFTDFLEAQHSDYFVAGNLTGEQVEQVRERYPYMISKTEGFTYSIFCFSKKKPVAEVEESLRLNETADFLKPGVHWSRPAGARRNEKTGEPEYYIDETEEYGMTFTVQLSDVIYSRHSMIVASATITPLDDTADGVLVVDIHDSKGPIWWRGTNLKDFAKGAGNRVSIHTAELLSGFDFKAHPYGETKIYIWNRGKGKMLVQNFSVKIIEVNPVVYGLYEAL